MAYARLSRSWALTRTRGFLARIRQASSGVKTQTRWSLIAWPALGLTAAAAAILFVAQGGALETGRVSPVATIAQVQPAAFRLPLEPAEVKLTAAALLLRRGGQQQSLVDDMAPAFTAYRAGEYRAAAAEFERMQPAHTDSVEVAFYLGVSRLLANDANGAVAALETAARNQRRHVPSRHRVVPWLWLMNARATTPRRDRSSSNSARFNRRSRRGPARL